MKDIFRDELSIGECFKYILKRIPLVIMTSITGALCFYLIAAVVVSPVYVSDFKISVYSMPGQQINPMGTLQADTLLAQDYAVLIKSRDVAERVIDELTLLKEGKPMNPQELAGSLFVDPGDGTTRTISVSVLNSDPFLAADIAAAYEKKIVETIKEIYVIDNIKIIEESNIPVQKYSPDTRKYVLLGIILGAIGGAGLLTIMFMAENFDDSKSLMAGVAEK